MTMIRSRSVSLQLGRLGHEVHIYFKSQNGTDAHNNPQWDYVKETETDSAGNTIPVTATCVRSYPNRNQQQDSTRGPYEEDDPIFFFPPEDAPASDSRIEYPEDANTVAAATETTTYEMRAPTRYDTHVTMFGALVSD